MIESHDLQWKQLTLTKTLESVWSLFECVQADHFHVYATPTVKIQKPSNITRSTAGRITPEDLDPEELKGYVEVYAALMDLEAVRL